jgi:microcystin-dependent protein
MLRIDVATATPSLPAPAAAGTPGYFTEGNPATATPATVVTADWLNAVQEELIGVITAAGLTPSKTNLTQLRQAIEILGASGAVPAGAVAFFGRTTAPTGWLKANGALVSRTVYATLFSAIGTTFGAGDGSTTFALPDLRGEFLRSWDDGRGVDTGRTLGSAQGGTITAYDLPSGGQGIASPAPSALQTAADFGLDAGVDADWTGRSAVLSTTVSPSTPSSANWLLGRMRPRNVALLACIKF